MSPLQREICPAFFFYRAGRGSHLLLCRQIQCLWERSQAAGWATWSCWGLSSRNRATAHELLTENQLWNCQPPGLCKNVGDTWEDHSNILDSVIQVPGNAFGALSFSSKDKSLRTKLLKQPVQDRKWLLCYSLDLKLMENGNATDSPCHAIESFPSLKEALHHLGLILSQPVSSPSSLEKTGNLPWLEG